MTFPLWPEILRVFDQLGQPIIAEQTRFVQPSDWLALFLAVVVFVAAIDAV